MKKQTGSEGRKVHITLTEDTHHRLRVKCAIEDVTIQEFVSRLVEQAVQDVQTVKIAGGSR